MQEDFKFTSYVDDLGNRCYPPVVGNSWIVPSYISFRFLNVINDLSKSSKYDITYTGKPKSYYKLPRIDNILFKEYIYKIKCKEKIKELEEVIYKVLQHTAFVEFDANNLTVSTYRDEKINITYVRKEIYNLILFTTSLFYSQLTGELPPVIFIELDCYLKDKPYISNLFDIFPSCQFIVSEYSTYGEWI